ncbi:MAG: DUF3179 domain-containing protein [Deltaproteobacteria bacterium]|nr:DUF3179 domain-containing protein [Deltaproteobacteria bacterium]
MYSRNLNGKILTLAASGWTYKSTFVLYDKETMSLWYPEKGGLRGISGKHLDQFLPMLTSEYTQWKRWADNHPDSKVLK